MRDVLSLNATTAHPRRLANEMRPRYGHVRSRGVTGFQGQATDTLAPPRCFGRMRLASLTRSDQRRVGISFGS